MLIRARIILPIALALFPALAMALTLQWPAACAPGRDCFVQNYVDHDPTPAARDFTCGPATYDGHDGTDIRLRNLAAMRAGVAVLAPADGVVLGTRDNMPDVSIRDEPAGSVADHECGNGVHLQLADGYRAQLCHMRRGSIRVHTGDHVKAGDTLGLIGLSGQTEFPHVHISVWKDSAIIDPFDNLPMATACSSAAPAAQLWAPPVAYQPTNLLGDGFVTEMPPEKPLRDSMRDTPVSVTEANIHARMLTYWVDAMGLRGGDVLAMSITAPDGKPLVEKNLTLDRAQAVYFTYIGKRNRAELAPGNYHAHFTLTREGAVLLKSQHTLEVK
jgi:hypothetical protein